MKNTLHKSGSEEIFKSRGRDISNLLSNTKNLTEEYLLENIHSIASLCGFKEKSYSSKDFNRKVGLLHNFFRILRDSFTYYEEGNGVSIELLKSEFTNRNSEIDIFSLFNGHEKEIKRQIFIDRVNSIITYVCKGVIHVGLRNEGIENEADNSDLIKAIASTLDPEGKNKELKPWLQKRLQEVEDTGTGLETIADFIIMNKDLKRIQIGEPTIEELYSLLNE